MIRRLSACALLVAGLGFGGAQAAGASELDALLADYLEESGLTGISLAIASGDAIETATAGYLDSDQATPVTDRTRFYIASSGKSAVATAILGYVADAKLALDAPIWPLVADIDGITGLENIETVTLRQLLDHSSGLADYLDDSFNDLAFAAGARGVSIPAALAAAYGEPAFFAPGQGSEYSNSNYVLLGHILEGLAGSIGAALEEKVIGPAGMTDTTTGIGASTANAAHGHGEDGTDYSIIAWASTFGDGPLVSTPRDMTRFATALFRDEKLIPADLLAEMLTGSKADPGYGLGMGIDSDEWGGWYGHTGGYDGYEAEFRYYPEHDLALAYAANGTSFSEDFVLDLVAQWYLEED